jgi:DNA (cytosine-5)-methyltransferase 3A
MTVLSLFDGISAERVALERAGIKVGRYYASEIKPHAIKIAQSMFPDTVQLGDVTKIDFTALPPVDLLIFGSPCQDLSCANSEQKGLEGERSGLFYKAVEAIRICKPRWFLMENVASMKPSEKEKISRALGEFYTNDLIGIYCEPLRINSSLVSAQMRDRLYWCNWKITQPKDKGIILQDVLEQDGENLKEKSYALTATYKKDSSFRRQRTMIEQRSHGYNKGGFFTDKAPILTKNGACTDNNHVVTNPEKSLALTANYGKMNEKNFAKGQGQLVSIALKDKAPCVSTEFGGFTNYSKEHGYAETQALIIDAPESYFEQDKAYALTASYGKKAGILDHVKNCAELIKVGNIKNDSISCRVYSPEGKATTQNANGGGQGTKTGLYKIGENVRKLTPRECCLLQTYDERVFDLFSTERPPQKHKVLEVIKLGNGKAAVIREKEINPDWIEWHKTPHPPYMSKSAFYNVFGDSFTVDVIVHILQCNREMMSQ